MGLWLHLGLAPFLPPEEGQISTRVNDKAMIRSQTYVREAINPF